MAVNGNTVLMYIGASLIGGQQDVTITEERDIIDVSAKGDDARQLLPARYASTVELDAFYVASDTAQGLLDAAIAAGTTVSLKKYVNSVSDVSATAYVTSIAKTFPDMEAGTIAITLEITGTWA